MKLRFRINSSLRTRLFQLVIIALLPALVLIIYYSGEQRLKALGEAEKEALRAARLVAANQRRLIDSSGHLLVALSELSEVRDRDPGSCSALFASLIKKYPPYANLGLADLRGDVICNARSTPAMVNIADRSYFRDVVRHRRLAIGNYQVGQISGKPSVNLGYPVFDRDQQLAGVLFLSIDLAWFNQSAKIAGLPTGSVVTLTDYDGTILSHYPGGENWVGKSLRESRIHAYAVARGEATAESTDHDGRERLYGLTTIGSSVQPKQMFLHVGIPKEYALADANWFLLRSLVALLIVGALALLAVWYLGDVLLVRQLKSLAETTARIGDGDFTARTGLAKRKNEIDRFAASLDKMAELLERRDIDAEEAKQRVQRQLERISALREIDMAISSALDLRAMLKVLLEKVDLALPGGVATVHLINRQSGQLEAAACRGLAEEDWQSENPRIVLDFEKTVLDNRIPLTIAKVQTDNRAAGDHIAAKFGLVSCLCVPMVAAGELEGLIAFYTREEHAFSDDEIDFLTTIAGLSAVASHNNRLFREIRQRESEASALYALTATASQSLDLNVTLKQAVTKIGENFHFDSTRVYLYNREMTALELKACEDSLAVRTADALTHQCLNDLRGEVADCGEAIIFDDVTNEACYRGHRSTRNSAVSTIRFVAMLPLKTKLITWGVAMFAGTEPRKLTDVETRLLTSVSQQIAITVENANLYEQTATKAQELSALYSFADLAGQSLDLNVLLRETTAKILEIFRFDAARVYWRHGDGDNIKLVTHTGFPVPFAPLGSYAVGQGRIGRILETGCPMYVEDMANDDAYLSMANSRALLEMGFRGSFLLPIKTGGKCVGVMNFLSKRPHPFSQSDIRLIDALVYHLGVAAGNATLYTQVERKTIELEQANRAKDEFLGVVSHELRTPLNVIKGYADVLSAKMFGELNQQQESALDKIKNQSANLLNMINDVLCAITIDAQTVKVAAIDVDLGALMAELKESYRFAATEQRQITWDCAADLPILRVDDEKLRAILQNLINNAVKFTEQGAIALSARTVPEGHGVEVRVADTGIGIPPDKIDSIFGMFQQVDSSVTRGYGGVGLGLYIVKNYLDLMGGSITVDSELGKGTTFVVTLPVKPSLRAPAGGTEVAHQISGPANPIAPIASFDTL